MARRRKSQRRTASPGNALIALLLLLAVYLYQNGTLQRWWDSLVGSANPDLHEEKLGLTRPALYHPHRMDVDPATPPEWRAPPPSSLTCPPCRSSRR